MIRAFPDVGREKRGGPAVHALARGAARAQEQEHEASGTPAKGVAALRTMAGMATDRISKGLPCALAGTSIAALCRNEDPCTFHTIRPSRAVALGS